MTKQGDVTTKHCLVSVWETQTTVPNSVLSHSVHYPSSSSAPQFPFLSQILLICNSNTDSRVFLLLFYTHTSLSALFTRTGKGGGGLIDTERRKETCRRPLAARKAGSRAGPPVPPLPRVIACVRRPGGSFPLTKKPPLPSSLDQTGRSVGSAGASLIRPSVSNYERISALSAFTDFLLIHFFLLMVAD